jgi:hypothetical protein
MQDVALYPYAFVVIPAKAGIHHYVGIAPFL